MGGGGGIRGLEGASDTGNGGSGRHAYFVNSYSSYLLDTRILRKLWNNTRSQTSSAVSMSRVFADAGQSATTFFSNPATDRSYSSGDSYRHSCQRRQFLWCRWPSFSDINIHFSRIRRWGRLQWLRFTIGRRWSCILLLLRGIYGIDQFTEQIHPNSS